LTANVHAHFSTTTVYLLKGEEKNKYIYKIHSGSEDEITS